MPAPAGGEETMEPVITTASAHARAFGGLASLVSLLLPWTWRRVIRAEHLQPTRLHRTGSRPGARPARASAPAAHPQDRPAA